jgi:metalloendopeptidase OMA1, mitochondrial
MASARRNRWVATLMCWLILTVAAIGCGPPDVSERSAPAGQGPGHREQPLALSPRQELAVGIRAYNEVIDEYHDRLLPPDNAAVVRVRTITMRIARAAEIEPLQREINLRLRGYRFQWEANVIRDRKINAFCLPGGKVFVFTGILPIAQNDDQLATVLSHEIAHALAHHASERLARDQQSGGGIFGTLGKLRFNREQESEADHIGLFLMTFAGYDPHQAVAFWERMARRMAQEQQPPEWLSDHPSDEHRIAAMRKWVPQAIAGKKAFDEGRIAPPR